jgi:hypothetical protein
MLQTKAVEKIKTHFKLNNFFLKKIVPFMRCGKTLYSRAGHRWQYNAAHVHCMLDT